jgi:hypothetical protein
MIWYVHLIITFLFFIDHFFQCGIVNDWVVKSIVVPLDTHDAVKLFVEVQLLQYQKRDPEAMNALITYQNAAISKVSCNIPSY